MNPAWPIKIPRYFIDVARWPANSTLPRECNINRNGAAARVKTFIGVDQPRSSLHLYYSGSLYARYFNSSTSPQFSTQESTGIPLSSPTPDSRFEGGISRIELYLECVRDYKMTLMFYYLYWNYITSNNGIKKMIFTVVI